MTTKLMNVGYARVSSDEQREQQTIKSQRAEIERYCATNKIKLDAWYLDDGVTGSIPLSKREPGGASLMADCEAGKIANIYILKFDRIGRNARDLGNLFYRFDNRLHVTVHSITQQLPPGPQGIWMRQQWSSMAEFDRANILANTFRGLEAKARSGGYCGGPVPFGYAVKGEKRNAVIVVDPVAAVHVKYIFKQASKGCTCGELAAYLNNANVPTPRQNARSFWRNDSVRFIIRNPIYTGTKEWARRQWVKTEDDAGNIKTHLRHTPERTITTAVPALVTQHLWDLANRRVKENASKEMGRAKEQYLLRHLIICAKCGLRYIGRGNYYSCVGRQCARRLYADKPGCDNRNIPRYELENMVWRQCEEYLKNPDEAIEEAKRQQASTKPADTAAALAKAQDQLKSNDAAREKAHDVFVDGSTTRVEFQRQMTRLSEKRAGIEATITQLRAASASRRNQAQVHASVRSTLERLRDSIKTGFGFAEKRRIVEALVNIVFITETDGVSVDYHINCDSPGWSPKNPAATPKQIRAGAKGLSVALSSPLRYPLRPIVAESVTESFYLRINKSLAIPASSRSTHDGGTTERRMG